MEAHCQSRDPKGGGEGSLVIGLLDVYSDYRLGNALPHLWDVWRASVTTHIFS